MAFCAFHATRTFGFVEIDGGFGVGAVVVVGVGIFVAVAVIVADADDFGFGFHKPRRKICPRLSIRALGGFRWQTESHSSCAFTAIKIVNQNTLNLLNFKIKH